MSTSQFDSDPDVHLMLRFGRGDDDAFDELVRRNHRRVLNLVFRFIGVREDAHDLTQDVFLGVWRSRQSYRPAARFSTWLYKNTLNMCLNYNRSMRLRRTVSLSGGDDETRGLHDVADPRDAPPLTDLEQDELAAKVKEAIDTLPPNQRAAVLLSRYEKLSYKDIASTLDLSVQAVKSLLSRAKDNLRYKLSFYVSQGE